jgi:hypothetical protein
MLAANALHSSGWENARLRFPISAAALQSIRIGEGCADVLREVIETAKTTQPQMLLQNQAISRPPRFPAMR